MGLIDELSESRDRACTALPGGMIPFIGRKTAASLLFFLIIFLPASFPVFSQNLSANSNEAAYAGAAVPLAAEISRLEKLSAVPSAERLDAFLKLIRLHQLSGDSEAALGTCSLALAAFPGEGRFLLEQGRLLISQGEFDKAEAPVVALQKSGDRELLKQGRLLAAKLEAFRSSLQMLNSLSEDPDFAEFKNDIYFTLWKLTGLTYWKDKLGAEFPLSPEAKIAAGTVNANPGPLWLLFPGRDSIAFSSPAPASPAVQTPSPASAVSVSQTQASQASVLQTPVLQTGLFGREDNAKALAGRLQRAGFEPQISPRMVNGSNLWAVTVSGGSDMNATIKKLKDAGFESFPVKL